jgi:hypothetical protein
LALLVFLCEMELPYAFLFLVVTGVLKFIARIAVVAMT